MPLTSQPIQLQLDKAMCAGMIPVSIEGHANIKLAGREEEGLEAAVERFLGKGFDTVVRHLPADDRGDAARSAGDREP